MISVHVDDDNVLSLVRSVYANRLNAASRGARYSMNARKQKFMRAFVEAASVEGSYPVCGGQGCSRLSFCVASL